MIICPHCKKEIVTEFPKGIGCGSCFNFKGPDRTECDACEAAEVPGRLETYFTRYNRRSPDAPVGR